MSLLVTKVIYRFELTCDRCDKEVHDGSVAVDVEIEDFDKEDLLLCDEWETHGSGSHLCPACGKEYTDWWGEKAL